MGDQNWNVNDYYPKFNRSGVASFPYPLQFNGGIVNGDFIELFENFAKLPQTNASAAYQFNTNFELLGTNATDGDCIFSTTVAGIEIETDGATSDSEIIAPHLGTNFTAWTGIKWGTENQTEWETTIMTGASVAAITLWAGLKLTNTPVVATDNDQVFFRFSTADSNTTWQCISSRTDVDTTVDSGVTVSANTIYKLRIKIDSSRRPHFFINDIEVSVGAALVNDIDLIPYIGVLTVTGAAAKKVTICYERIRRLIFE